jgi:WD40 repeat protein
MGKSATSSVQPIEPIMKTLPAGTAVPATLMAGGTPKPATNAKVETWKSPKATGNQVYNSVAISADGTRVVGGTYVQGPGKHMVGMYGWDATGAQQLKDTFEATAPPIIPPGTWTRRGILSVSISSDGVWAASGGGLRPATTGAPADSGFVDIYNLGAMPAARAAAFPIAGQMVNAVAMSGDGSTVVAGADAIYIYARTGATTWTGPVVSAVPTGAVRRVSISDDGKWIAAAADDGWIVLLNNPAGAGGAVSTASWQIPPDTTTTTTKYFFAEAVSMAADGSGFAVAGADGNVYYFDTSSFTPSSTLSPAWPVPFSLPNCRSCRWVSASSDGSLIAAVGAEEDPVTKKLTGRGNLFMLSNTGSSASNVWTSVPYTNVGPNCIAMDANGAYVAASDGTTKHPDGNFYLFKGSDGSFKWQYPTHPYVDYCVAMSANGNAMAGASDDGRVYYFSVP